jgi:hypothetical protein
VTEKSFNSIVSAVSEKPMPWIANFVLHMFPFDKIEQELGKRGYVTEKLEGETFSASLYPMMSRIEWINN